MTLWIADPFPVPRAVPGPIRLARTAYEECWAQRRAGRAKL